MSDRSRFRLKAGYCLIQCFYWMAYCILGSFAALFLQERGYSNSRLGLILAGGNILGFLLGPVLASFIDRFASFTVFRAVSALLGVQAVSLLLLRIPRTPCFLLSFCFVLYSACHIAGNGLNTQLSVDLEHAGCGIDYGAARGLGSAAYVLASILLGRLVSVRSVSLLPSAALVLAAGQFVSHRMVLRSRKASAGLAAGTRGSGTSLLRFLAGNVRFTVLLAGIACLFFSHNLIGTYLIHIVRNAGGDTADMGYLSGFMATVEIPVLFLYASVTRGRSCSRILRLSVIMFAVKALCVALAPGLPLLFAAFSLQIFSFALYTPAMVQYVSEHVDARDSAKGQTLAYGVTALGTVFATSVGGVMFDRLPVSSALLWGAGICAAGSLLCCIGIESGKTHRI